MATMIQQESISLAWLEAFEHLLECGGKDVNLSVVIKKLGSNEECIRRILDEALAKRQEQSINTVANTIFPEALYLPDRLGDKAREHLYENSKLGFNVAKRHPANKWGRYIQRLIAWPGQKGEFNQLEETVLRLRREIALPNTCSSIYELGLTDPEECIDAGADLRINRPDYDHWRRGSPCLSHISLTLMDRRRLHMTALYRNQQFFRKAYGNYVGLSRLMNFFCREVGCEMGELMCVATHADAELGKRDITAIIERCRSASGWEAA